MISVLISALFLGNLFPSRPASSQPAFSLKFAKDEFGEPLGNILGRTAFKTREQAQPYISFDKNNTFDRREIIVLDWGIQGLIYGAVLEYMKESNEWLMQTSKSNDPFGPSFAGKPPEKIGKMLINLAPLKNEINIAPGGPAIEQEPGEEEEEEGKEQVEDRPNYAEVQVEEKPSIKK